jgi:hypothetical protein
MRTLWSAILLPAMTLPTIHGGIDCGLICFGVITFCSVTYEYILFAKIIPTPKKPQKLPTVLSPEEAPQVEANTERPTESIILVRLIARESAPLEAICIDWICQT